MKRVAPATTYSEACQRANCAALALKHLREALDFARYAPNTRARIRKAITSAGGALRHANLLVHKHQREHRQVREARSIDGRVTLAEFVKKGVR